MTIPDMPEMSIVFWLVEHFVRLYIPGRILPSLKTFSSAIAALEPRTSETAVVSVADRTVDRFRFTLEDKYIEIHSLTNVSDIDRRQW